MILKKIYDKEVIYDGVEENLRQIDEKKMLLGNEKIPFSIILENMKELGSLINVIGLSNFNSIITECNLKASSLLGIFKDQNNLKSYYTIIESKAIKYVIVLSWGEFQPMRYKLYIEGIWEAADTNL